MLRYGVSAVVCSPWLMRARPANAGGLGWTRAFLLALAAGPLFGTLVNAGMLFAPLSHTAIMVPAVSMLGGMLAGRLFLDESVAAPRWAGAAIMTAGLVWLMLQGVHSPAMPYAWLGDCLFLIAGAMWASYTFMLRRWNAEPVLAVSMVNAISGVLYFPVYLFLIHDHFPHIGWGAFGRAAILQGIIAAFLTVYAYSQSVRFLGAARAAVLPAAVAPLTMTLGAITPGEFPAPQQMAALALAMAGFMGAVGLWPW
jgi:drug/metabolite transporter (DMT)-like permease